MSIEPWQALDISLDEKDAQLALSLAISRNDARKGQKSHKIVTGLSDVDVHRIGTTGEVAVARHVQNWFPLAEIIEDIQVRGGPERDIVLREHGKETFTLQVKTRRGRRKGFGLTERDIARDGPRITTTHAALVWISYDLTRVRLVGFLPVKEIERNNWLQWGILDDDGKNESWRVPWRKFRDYGFTEPSLLVR